MPNRVVGRERMVIKICPYYLEELPPGVRSIVIVGYFEVLCPL